MECGICIKGNGDVLTGKLYKLETFKLDLYFVQCEDGRSGGVYKHRFQIIPNEVVESPLFKAVYGETNGEEKE